MDVIPHIFKPIHQGAALDWGQSLMFTIALFLVVVVVVC